MKKIGWVKGGGAHWGWHYRSATSEIGYGDLGQDETAEDRVRRAPIHPVVCESGRKAGRLEVQGLREL